jgi:hypothetical protein
MSAGRRRGLACLAIVGFGLVVIPASSSAYQTSAEDTFQNDIAMCMVRLKTSQARRFVVGSGAPPSSDRCLGAEWKQATIRVQTYRYLLARVLLQQDYAGGIPSELSQLRAIPLVNDRSDRGAGDNDRQRLAIADCVIRKEPSKAFALVATRAGEAEATPVMSALAPVVAACSAGKRLRYPTGFEMHEAIVTRMYQLAYAARKPRDA